MKPGKLRVIVLAVALAAATAVAACGAPERPTGQARAPGEYLVTLDAPDRVHAIADLYGRFGIRGVRDLGNNRYLVTLTEDPGPASMEQLRSKNGHIQAVQPNFVYR